MSPTNEIRAELGTVEEVCGVNSCSELRKYMTDEAEIFRRTAKLNALALVLSTSDCIVMFDFILVEKHSMEYGRGRRMEVRPIFSYIEACRYQRVGNR